MGKILLEMVSLSTPRGRILLFSALAFFLLVIPYHLLTGTNVSVWQRIGWESAPSVGLTRAFWLLLHGQFNEAWHRNWLIYPVFVIILVLVILDIIKLRSVRHLQPKDIN